MTEKIHTILVIDDEAYAVEMLCQILREDGYNVIVAQEMGSGTP